jgi:hypothetical protein
MDFEEKKILKDSFELIQENNEMLHKIRNVQKRETLWFLIKTFLVIGIFYGLFYSFGPQIEKALKIYDSIENILLKSGN